MPKKPAHKRGGGAGVPLSASQNFLTSGKTIRRLLSCTDIGSGDLVVEIGPGKGHITRELLEICGSLKAAELDPALCARLRKTFAHAPKLSLFQGDFLRMPLPEGPYKVFANIPFSRTTEIVRRLVWAQNPPKAAWLLMEKGAALRFCGRPRESLSALLLRPFFGVEICAQVPRQEFHPCPRVDAALLCLRRKSPPDVPWEQREAYRAFIREAWGKGFGGLLTKKQVSTALRLESLPPLPRDANLLYVQWLCLFRCWQRFQGASPSRLSSSAR